MDEERSRGKAGQTGRRRIAVEEKVGDKKEKERHAKATSRAGHELTIMKKSSKKNWVTELGRRDLVLWRSLLRLRGPAQR